MYVREFNNIYIKLEVKVKQKPACCMQQLKRSNLFTQSNGMPDSLRSRICVRTIYKPTLRFICMYLLAHLFFETNTLKVSVL